MPKLTTALAAGFALSAASLGALAETYSYRIGDFGRTRSTAINNSAHATGTGNPGGRDNQAYLWNGRTHIFLPPMVDQDDEDGGVDYLQGSIGFDINNAGQATGYVGFDSDPSTGLARVIDRAFIWDGVSILLLAPLSGEERAVISGRAINESGHVTGESDTASGETHAFLGDGVAMRDLGTLVGDYSKGAGINKSGKIAGVSTLAAPQGEEGLLRGFYWDGVRMV